VLPPSARRPPNGRFQEVRGGTAHNTRATPGRKQEGDLLPAVTPPDRMGMDQSVAPLYTGLAQGLMRAQCPRLLTPRSMQDDPYLTPVGNGLSSNAIDHLGHGGGQRDTLQLDDIPRRGHRQGDVFLARRRGLSQCQPAREEMLMPHEHSPLAVVVRDAHRSIVHGRHARPHMTPRTDSGRRRLGSFSRGRSRPRTSRSHGRGGVTM
jgi:hypothetical protein